jgi:hypothetical protein
MIELVVDHENEDDEPKWKTIVSRNSFPLSLSKCIGEFESDDKPMHMSR